MALILKLNSQLYSQDTKFEFDYLDEKIYDDEIYDFGYLDEPTGEEDFPEVLLDFGDIDEGDPEYDLGDLDFDSLYKYPPVYVNKGPMADNLLFEFGDLDIQIPEESSFINTEDQEIRPDNVARKEPTLDDTFLLLAMDDDSFLNFVDINTDDEGTYNFGDIDEGDETAVGNYDFLYTDDIEPEDDSIFVFGYDFGDYSSEVIKRPDYSDTYWLYRDIEYDPYVLAHKYISRTIKEVLDYYLGGVTVKDNENSSRCQYQVQYFYNERMNKMLIQYEFNTYLKSELNIHSDEITVMKILNKRIIRNFQKETDMYIEILNTRNSVRNNGTDKNIITPFTIGYWKSLSGNYEFIEDRGEVFGDIKKSPKMNLYIKEVINLAKKYKMFDSLNKEEKDNYLYEYKTIYDQYHDQKTTYYIKLRDLDDKYKIARNRNHLMSLMFAEYDKIYNAYFNCSLPEVNEYTRRVTSSVIY